MLSQRPSRPPATISAPNGRSRAESVRVRRRRTAIDSGGRPTPAAGSRTMKAYLPAGRDTLKTLPQHETDRLSSARPSESTFCASRTRSSALRGSRALDPPRETSSTPSWGTSRLRKTSPAWTAAGSTRTALSVATMLTVCAPGGIAVLVAQPTRVTISSAILAIRMAMDPWRRPSRWTFGRPRMVAPDR